MLQDLLHEMMSLIEFHQLRQKYKIRTSYHQELNDTDLAEGKMTK